MSLRGRASIRRESLTPWLVAPVLAVILLVMAITQVPGKECEDLSFQYIDDTAPRNLVIGIAIVESMLLGLGAVTRWTSRVLAVGALFVPPLMAVALATSAETAKIFAILSFAGSFPAVVGLFRVLEMQVQGIELRNADLSLPLYLGATAWCLIPFLTIVSLVIARHPICEFG